MPERRQLRSPAQENRPSRLLQGVADQVARLDAEHAAPGRRLGDRARDEVAVVDDPDALGRPADHLDRRDQAEQLELERLVSRLVLELQPVAGPADTQPSRGWLA